MIAIADMASTPPQRLRNLAHAIPLF